MVTTPSSGNLPQSVQCPTDQFFRDLNIEFLIHELKDPLSIVETGLLMLLEKQEITGPLSARQEKILQRVLRGSHKIRSMVYELLEVGRAEAACVIKSTFCPYAIVKEVLFEVIEVKDFSLFEQLNNLDDTPAKLAFLDEHGIVLIVEPGLQRIEIEQDKTKFMQISANLLKNALHHRRQVLKIHLGMQNDRICLSVTDDGPGIDLIHHEAVFERYKQVAQDPLVRKGHGLGLAMARILARSMGGEIVLESELDHGATFQLQLPVAAP